MRLIADSQWLNWRFGPRFCVRLIPGLWLPQIRLARNNRYLVIALPLCVIAFDWGPFPRPEDKP